jgi:hypothetical protein
MRQFSWALSVLPANHLRLLEHPTTGAGQSPSVNPGRLERTSVRLSSNLAVLGLHGTSPLHRTATEYCQATLAAELLARTLAMSSSLLPLLSFSFSMFNTRQSYSVHSQYSAATILPDVDTTRRLTLDHLALALALALSSTLRQSQIQPTDCRSGSCHLYEPSCRIHSHFLLESCQAGFASVRATTPQTSSHCARLPLTASD